MKKDWGSVVVLNVTPLAIPPGFIWEKYKYIHAYAEPGVIFKTY